MIANMNEKANRNKLLAAFLALAMVAVCGAVVISDSTSYGAESEATKEIGLDGTTATIYSAGQMRDVLAGIGTTGDYENVEKIVIGADFTVESKIEINKSIVVDGNNHNITAIGNAAWTGTSGDDKYAVTVNNADAEVCNIVIDNGGVAYGFNVFGTADNTVKLKNITSNNSAGAGFCFNGAVVEATSLSATGYKWGGANADKGADVSLDTINGIGSIYTENSTSDAVEITFPEKYVAPVELGVGTSGTQGYYNGFYTNLNEAAAAYAAVSITAQDATKTIDVNMLLLIFIALKWYGP